MKIAPSISILLPAVLLAGIAPTPVAGQQIMDFLDDFMGSIFGDSTDGNQDKEKDKDNNDKDESGSAAIATENMRALMNNNIIIGPVIDRLADYVSGGADTEIARGRKAYDCMNQISDMNGNSGSRSGPARKAFRFPDGAMQAVSYGIIYQLFDKTEDIDIICPDDSSVRRIAAISENSNEENTNIRRRTQVQAVSAEPAYPYLDPGNVPTGFLSKNSNVASFLASGDLNNRASIGALVDQLNSQISVYATASENLDIASEWVDTVGDFASTIVPEAGIVFAGVEVDFGSFLRGVSSLLSNVSTAINRNITRRERALAQLANHRSLIDSAEIEAGFRNTQTLIDELVSLKQKIEELEANTRA